MELVGEDTAHLRRGQKYGLGPLGSHPPFHRSIGLKIGGSSICSQDSAILTGKAAYQRASNQTTVPGNPDTLSVQIKAHPILERFF
jgi:hypothetical protein